MAYMCWFQGKSIEIKVGDVGWKQTKHVGQEEGQQLKYDAANHLIPWSHGSYGSSTCLQGVDGPSSSVGRGGHRRYRQVVG